MKVRGAVALAAIVMSGCMGDEEDRPAGTERPSESTPAVAELPAGLPPADAVRPPRNAKVLPPLGPQPAGSKRVSIFVTSEAANHFPATLVFYLPPGWRTESPPAGVSGQPPTPGTPAMPPFEDGLGPNVLVTDGQRMVAIAFCTFSLPRTLERAGRDDPTGDLAARETADRYYLPGVGSLERPRAPRLAPHLYRAVHQVALGFPGGGCLLLADPAVPDPTRPDSASGYSPPDQIEKARRKASRQPLPEHLVSIAKGTTGYWGRSTRLPESSLRAEAIARRAQRATLAAPRMRYDERLSYCRDGSRCRETEAGVERLVERERASSYVFADVTDASSSASRTLLIRAGRDVRRSPDGLCWDPDSYGGSGPSGGGFLFRGSFSPPDERVAFFPPLYRWQLSYSAPRPAGPAQTELRWRSYFDHGTVIVDNRSLRLIRMDRAIRSGTRSWQRRRVAFSYPASLKRVTPKPECRHEGP
jgi:hypothetical protein